MHVKRWVSGLSVLAVLAGVACGDETRPVGTGTPSATTGTASGGSGGTTSSSTTSSGGDGGMMMAGAGGMTTTGAGGAPPGYPDGPYGNQMGDTFPFLTWEGYLSTDPAALATTETWTDTYTSLDLHGSGAQYALIHTTLSG